MTLVNSPELQNSSQQARGDEGVQSQSSGSYRSQELQETQSQEPGRVNVGASERAVSVAAGSILALAGLRRGDLPGLLIAAVGGGLVYRGATGHCHMYEAIGVDTAHAEEAGRSSRSTHVAESYLINKSPEELYAYWRNFENLPTIMTHLESVQTLEGTRSHWVAKAPRIAGGKVEWDAEITRDEPNVTIHWRSLPGADVDNSGAIRFDRAPGDRGTMVHVMLDYIPPAGQIGRLVARLFGEEPQQQIKDDLRKFKRIMETGEVPTITGQPRGSCMGTGGSYE